MPGLQVGVYLGELTAGTEVSSAYEGRHLTVLESEMIHPFRASTFVNKGDPVLLCRTGVPATYGIAVGVSFATATAATDLIAIDTEGIWNLTVFAEDDLGIAAIEIGDPIYIHDGSTGAATLNGLGDAELSKITNPATQRFFGYALGRMVAGGSGQIAVKVHFDQRNNWLEDEAPLIFGDNQEVNIKWDNAQLNFVQLANWACPAGTGRVVRMSGTPTLQAGSQSATLSLFNTPIGAGATWAGALQAHCQLNVKSVDGYWAAGLFSTEYGPGLGVSSSAAVIALSWKNKSLGAMSGVMHSFIQIREYSTGGQGGGYDIQNLFEMPDHDATHVACADELVCQAGAAVAASHVFKVTIGAIPYWVMMDSTPPA